MAKLRATIPVQEVSARHAAGESLRSLAAAYGVNVHTLSKHLKRHGHQPRSRSEATSASNLLRPTGTGSRNGKGQAPAARKLYEAKKMLVQSHRNERGCQECGEKHPAVLDLHHLDRETKHPSLRTRLLDASGKRTYKGWMAMSYEDIEAEFKKCVVLCSNCHRIHEWGARAAH